jgi:hypothetical protein
VEKVEVLGKLIDYKLKEKVKYLGSESVDNEDCSHCPKHLQLTDSINKVLEVLRANPVINSTEEVPIAINNLKFLYYTVKMNQVDGTTKCFRYNDITPDLKGTHLDGEMQLMAEDVFKFVGISSVQILDPLKDEIIYYYRGVGDQKNILVQAILNKKGGKFKYFYYRPTELEKNPYNLPSMGVDSETDPTVIKKKVVTSVQPTFPPEKEVIVGKDKMNFVVSPSVDKRWRIVPTNVQIAKADISQLVGGAEGVRVSATSNLSLKGNEMSMNLQNEKGTQYAEIFLKTALNGKTESRVVVPYEVRFGPDSDKEALKVKGQIVEETNAISGVMSLTDNLTTYFRSEFRREKITNTTSYVIARDFAIAKDEVATLSVGNIGDKKNFVAIQHKKSIKDNVTMVLEVKVDDQRKAYVQYQLKAQF